MKKLLVVCLVLGLANMASATLSMHFDVLGLNPEGKLECETSYVANVVLDKTQDETTNVTQFQLGIALSGDCLDAAQVGTVIQKGQNATWTNGAIYPGPIIGRVEGNTLTAGPYFDDGDVVYSFTFDTGVACVGTTLTIDDVVLAAGAPPWGGPPIGFKSTINGVAMDAGAAVGDMNALSFECVPEPMTMALLGLGGLALIRRRRA